MNSAHARTAARLLLLSIGLGVVLGAFRWVPRPGALQLVAPTVESFAIIALVWWASRAERTLAWVHVLVSAATATLAVFGIGEAFYQAIFRRAFVPWTDLAFVSPLLNMVFETSLFDRMTFVVVPIATLTGLVAVLVFFIVRALDAAFRRGDTADAIVLFVVLGVFAVLRVGVGAADPARSVLEEPLAVRAARQIHPPQDEPDRPVAGSPRSERSVESEPSYAFPFLKDRDIHLFIVESYGHTLLSNADHRALIEPVYEELERRLRRSGYHGSTGFLVSPAFGGRSWLADATMLTGTFLDTQHKYERMIESDTRNLTHILGDAGYHRLLAAPGTYEADAEWRAFYEFDQYLFRYDFGYRGPFVSFGAMPDQFLIKRANDLAAAEGRPLFMNYLLVSSHVPFDRLPRYVDDWSLLEDGSIFNELEIRTFDNNWLGGEEYPDGYVASIEYTLTSITEFLARLEDEALVIVIGDHQPRIPIAEPDSTFSVPVHFLSRDLELVEPLRHYGFEYGFAPHPHLAAAPDEHPRMDRLLEMILDLALGVTPMYDYLQP
ncbi:MAG: sulfatase-like hydrolase/transferase [Spirochaetota bacterium]